ncbi:MAG: 16S rRNA (guanine(966)-N(2))-methyltransferase RsmD [Chloroflexi bacterium]|nr:16S rRNA (guanine(966)-N(2))-methyltransferase RsmD [Chloroflexota bacterium]
MRVTGGIARGRKLKRPPAGVRPTTDLVRSAIFDALEAQGVDSSRVLDLYAGSGALGIEALSRGGDWCEFVERDRTSAALIQENLAVTGLQERGRVHRIAVERALDRLEGPYSLLLADPPYDDDGAIAALESIASSPLLAPQATLVYEHGRRREPPEALGPLRLNWSRRYGDTQVSIYRQ